MFCSEADTSTAVSSLARYVTISVVEPVFAGMHVCGCLLDSETLKKRGEAHISAAMSSKAEF